jgi:hypothetical protein
MKFTKTLLRERKIYNSHGICTAGNGKVFLSYYPAEARMCRCSKWVVIGINGHEPDPEAHWPNYGAKTFIGKMRSTALEEAKQWAGKKYGIKDWARDPFGDWQDVQVLDRVKENMQ